jgi:hypothetical protein
MLINISMRVQLVSVKERNRFTHGRRIQAVARG